MSRGEKGVRRRGRPLGVGTDLVSCDTRGEIAVCLIGKGNAIPRNSGGGESAER